MMDELTQRISERLKLFPNLKEVLTKLDDGAITAFVEDAVDQARADGFTDANIVRGASLLAAHFCNLASNSGTSVSKQQVSVVSIEYFDRGGSDDYLVEYKRLKKALTHNTIRFL